MLKTETLLAFIQVAKFGSFTAAANVRGQTSMAISKQISQLENQLAQPLFERSTRKVKLTEFGHEFLLRAKKISAEHDSLDHWLATRLGKMAGQLTVVTQGNLVYDETVFPYLAEFNQLYPDITLVLDVQEEAIDISNDSYDIYWGVGGYLGDRHSGLKRRLFWRAPFGIFASPDYLNKFGTPKTPDDLSQHHMVGYSRGQQGNVLVVNKVANSQPTQMEYMTLNAPIKTASGQVKLAVQGLGLINAVADNQDIKGYLLKGELVPVLTQYWFDAVEVYLYYHQVKLEQPKVRAFIDFFLSKRDLW